MYQLREFPSLVNAVVTIFTTILSINVVILLLWLVALLKVCFRLKSRLKHSTDTLYDDVLDTQVEYRKSLFLLAMVFVELVATFLEIISSFKLIGIFLTDHLPRKPPLHYNESLTIVPEVNYSSSVHSVPVTSQCNISYEIPNMWSQYYNIAFFRFSLVGAAIFFCFTFSLVYTLMSYFILATKNSLKYAKQTNANLGREQKTILILSSIVVLCTLVALVRVEIFLMLSMLGVFIFSIQFFATLHYSLKLSQVLEWKRLDIKIAYGTGNHLYLKYSKGIRTYKLFVVLYNIMVGFFCFTGAMHCIRSNLTLILYPYEIYRSYGVCLSFNLSGTNKDILNGVMIFIDIFEKTSYFVSFLLLFIFNLCSLPKLLSRATFRCPIRCPSKLSMLKIPLLK